MTNVLVVGAGPTGLMAACELARYGVPFRIIDKAPSPSVHSKALAIQARSLELLQKLSLAETFVARGQTGIGLRLHVGGRRVASVNFSDIGDVASPYPYLLFLSQAETERLLTEKLRSLGGAVEREVELSELAPDDTGVGATLTFRDGRRSRERFDYVLGCDGAHSTVRHQLGLPFPGGAYRQDFLLADCRVEGAGDTDALNVFFGRYGVLVLFPMEGERKSRIIVLAPPAAGPEDISLKDVQRAARPFAPAMTLSEPRWVARFRLHHRGVDRYRRGRVFLCGDAAHIHSPVGGQGMNTGLQDAQNLAWKLGLLHRGQAGERILDSYHAERYPVGQVLLRTTDRFFRAAAATNPFFVYPRNLLVPLLARTLLVRPRWRRRIFRFVSQLGIRYRRGPLSEETGAWTAGPAAGERAPDGPLGAGRLFDQLKEPGFSLLAFAPDTSAAEPPDGPWRTLVVDTGRDGALAALYGVRERALYLIRPDGYVGWRSPGWDLRGARRYFTDRLGMSP